MDDGYSAIGSPNIFLRKNFERGHIYDGYYLIHDKLKTSFELYKPIPHFKIHHVLYKDMLVSFKDLTRIAKSDDEQSDMFVNAMYEYLGIKDLDLAEAVVNDLKIEYNFGGFIIYCSTATFKSINSYLIAYLKLYEWSMNKIRERGYGEPYYTHDKFRRIKACSFNLNRWIKDYSAE